MLRIFFNKKILVIRFHSIAKVILMLLVIHFFLLPIEIKACCYECGQGKFPSMCCSTIEECTDGTDGCTISEVGGGLFISCPWGAAFYCGAREINCCALYPGSSCCIGSYSDPCCTKKEDPCCGIKNKCCDSDDRCCDKDGDGNDKGKSSGGG